MSLFSRLAVILFIYGLKLYWFCLATDCRFVIWHCFRLRMFSLELHATFLISSYLLIMFSISIGIFYVNVGILTPCGYSVYLWTQVVLILPSYGLSLCYLTLFRLRMFSLELHATFLISSYLLLMFSISIGIFYVNVGILTPCGYSVYLWTQVVLILPSYGLSLCYLTLFPVTHVFVGVACHIPYLQLSVASVFYFNRNILCKCRYSHALRLFCLSMDSSCIDSA